MITRIAKSFSLAVKIAVISFERAFRYDHSLEEILGYTDELTSLPNLKAFERDKARLTREHVLVLIYVDNFKLVNDYFGHAAGNSVLRRIAFILGHCTEFCGTAYRLHGDEFALIVKREEAERICEEIHDSFRREDKITISLGVVTMEGEGISFEQLFKTADKALYQSKNQGRGMTTMIPVIAS